MLLEHTHSMAASSLLPPVPTGSDPQRAGGSHSIFYDLASEGTISPFDRSCSIKNGGFIGRWPGRARGSAIGVQEKRRM